MKHASIHSRATQRSTTVSQPRPITGPNGIAIAPPTYGIDFVDRQQSTDVGMTVQRQASDASLTAEGQQENRTGLPDQLKAGIESLSGISLSDVRVHTHSSAPARLNAHAYTQGRDIFVSSGQERHLPHEAWHVVQQAQGRVPETARLKSGVSINGDKALEREADLMGRRATELPAKGERRRETQTDERTDAESTVHSTPLLSAGSPVAQADIGFEFQTYKERSGFYKYDSETKKWVKSDDHKVYAQSVAADPPWRVENDGGDLEVVVERARVDQDGRGKLTATMDQIQQFFESAQNKQKEQTDEKWTNRKLKKVTNKTTFQSNVLPASTLHEDKNLLGTPQDWENNNEPQKPNNWEDLALYVTDDLKAHPQVTAGVGLDKLLETFELIGKAQYQEGGGKPQQKQEYANQLGFYQKSLKHRETIQSAMAVGKRAAEAKLSPSLQGFLTIIAEYIIGWQKAGELGKKTRYAKNYTPIMGRTNLATIFKHVLDEEEQKKFIELVKNEKELKTIFGLEQELFGKNLKLFGKKEPKDVTELELEKSQVENLKGKGFDTASQITVGDFLKLLADEKKESVDLSSEDYGPQAIGSQKKEKHVYIDPKTKGIAVELRKLRGEVPLKDWKTFALHAFDLIVLINKKEEKKNLIEFPLMTNNSFPQKEPTNLIEFPLTTNNLFAQEKPTSSSSSLTTGGASSMTNQQRLNQFRELTNNN